MKNKKAHIIIAPILWILVGIFGPSPYSDIITILAFGIVGMWMLVMRDTAAAYLKEFDEMYLFRKPTPYRKEIEDMLKELPEDRSVQYLLAGILIFTCLMFLQTRFAIFPLNNS